MSKDELVREQLGSVAVSGGDLGSTGRSSSGPGAWAGPSLVASLIVSLNSSFLNDVDTEVSYRGCSQNEIKYGIHNPRFTN